jgi:hypothetical protein
MARRFEVERLFDVHRRGEATMATIVRLDLGKSKSLA